MKSKLEIFIEKKHEELKKIMNEDDISRFLEKNELDEIYDNSFLENKLLIMKFLEILICMYFQNKGETAILKIKVEKLEKELQKLNKKNKK